MSGVIIAAATGIFYALTGNYRKEIKTMPVSVPVDTKLPGEVISQASASRHFQEIEAARRDQAQEQGSQIG